MKPITAKELAGIIGASESFTRHVLEESNIEPLYTVGNRLKLYDASIVGNVKVLAAARRASTKERMRQHGNKMYASGKLVRKSTRIEERLDRIEAALTRLVDASGTGVGSPRSNGESANYITLR